MLKIKRVYDPVSDDDGKRILIDRLWPRGISDEDLKRAARWGQGLPSDTSTSLGPESFFNSFAGFKKMVSDITHCRPNVGVTYSMLNKEKVSRCAV